MVITLLITLLISLVFIFVIDWDGAADAKEKAAEARANGDFSVAVEMFTKALSLGQVSAIALANRAECLLKLRRPLAAISDCDAAIAINPDSAKALR
jgi:suppressor of tumorigenicity protein 13